MLQNLKYMQCIKIKDIHFQIALTPAIYVSAFSVSNWPHDGALLSGRSTNFDYFEKSLAKYFLHFSLFSLALMPLPNALLRNNIVPDFHGRGFIRF